MNVRVVSPPPGQACLVEVPDGTRVRVAVDMGESMHKVLSFFQIEDGSLFVSPYAQEGHPHYRLARGWGSSHSMDTTKFEPVARMLNKYSFHASGHCFATEASESRARIGRTLIGPRFADTDKPHELAVFVPPAPLTLPKYTPRSASGKAGKRQGLTLVIGKPAGAFYLVFAICNPDQRIAGAPNGLWFNPTMFAFPQSPFLVVVYVQYVRTGDKNPAAFPDHGFRLIRGEPKPDAGKQ